MASQDDKHDDRVFPGKLDTYAALRSARETLAQGVQAEDGTFTPADPNTIALYSIAEELAGLAYILDGIRYSTRRS